MQDIMLSVKMPKALHTELKKTAVLEDRKIWQIVQEAVSTYLNK
jgi:hypothetical protein